MTEYTIKNTAPTSKATTLPFISEHRISSFDGKVRSLETKIFDAYLRDRICVECGNAVYELFVTEESSGLGKNKVICRVTDTVAKTAYTPRGKSAGAVQIQSCGWLIDLTDIDQVKAVLQDRNNPETLKEVIRHLLKGDLSVGDPHSRRAFNNVRLKVLGARRKNDREIMREISE